MPLRSQLQLEKAQQAARERSLSAQLAAYKPPCVERPNPLALARELATLHPEFVFRRPEDFNRRIRSKDPDKIRLVAAEHVFGRYPAPRHIRSVWYDDSRRAAAQETSALDLQRAFRRSLYLTCVSGGSVHKVCTGGFMTKKESHRFLAVSHTDSFVEAVWFTLACSFSDDIGVARRMAVSRIAQQSYEDPFWRESLRFFCLNPLPLAQTNDIIDFLRHEHAANPQYSLRGRTLRSVQEQVEQWHRAINRARRMGDAKWPGVDLKDAIYLDQPNAKGRRFDWKFSQIKTSHDLAEEGTKMHHCVYAYQQVCIAGDTSIWSLKVRQADPRDVATWDRSLTIEMDNAARRLVQLRGYANRLMNLDERQIVSLWASENGLSVAQRG